ncbi:unnamed protein product [Pleuronectes platessa]|uniref:Uncharacterized protein n=1 Tax=Pleuronectes platessa TaxID=8262 RepID=A0A9N7Y5N9_PLEPL|nr:unnamed protein product [Pleuronectes platessa]
MAQRFEERAICHDAKSQTCPSHSQRLRRVSSRRLLLRLRHPPPDISTEKEESKLFISPFADRDGEKKGLEQSSGEPSSLVINNSTALREFPSESPRPPPSGRSAPGGSVRGGNMLPDTRQQKDLQPE